MNAIRTAFPILGFWDTRQGGRAENQDSCGFVDTPHGLIAVVCDGMGGGPAGKEASTLAVQTIAEYFCKQEKASDDLKLMMKNAIEHANQAIISKCEDHPEMRGMGSTVVAVLFHTKAAVVGHVGDSRLYQFRHGNKVFRTEDHSLVADMVRSKELTEEQARLSQQTNVITKALGGKNGHLADIELLPYEKGDRFLLCTDGIWNALPEGDLVKRGAQTPSLAGAVDSIILMADELGRKNGNTHDNLTLAFFETKEDSTTKVKMNRKAINIIRALTVLCCISLLACVIMAVNLMKPSVEKEQLEQSKISIAEKNERIEHLNKQVDSLNKEVTASKEKAANVLMEMAKQKAADQLKQEANKEKEEAEKAKARDQEEKEREQQISIEITKIIKYLNDAVNQRAGKGRDLQLSNAKKALNTLLLKDKSHAEEYKKIINKLNEKKIKDSNSSDVKESVNSLITKLQNIKK